MKQKKTVEDYLKIIYILQRKKGAAHGADLAAELNVSRPTVSVALKGLAAEGCQSGKLPGAETACRAAGQIR